MPTANVTLSLMVVNGSKVLRGRKHALQMIELLHLNRYRAQQPRNGRYALVIPYRDEQELKEVMDDLMVEIHGTADRHQCVAECEAWIEGTDCHWPSIAPAPATTAPS